MLILQCRYATADETRLRIIRLMVAMGEESCLLSSRKEGAGVYQRLVMDPSYLEPLYAKVKALLDPEGIYNADFERFRQRFCLRESGCCRTGIQSDEFKAEAN